MPRRDASDPRDSRDAALIAAGRELVSAGLVVGSLGNLSVRTSDGFRLTPSRMDYRDIAPDDLVTMSLAGRRIAGSSTPSREAPFHAAIYDARPDVGAVVHTHSPHAAAWSFLGLPLEPHPEEAAYYDLAPVQTTQPAAAGTQRIARATVDGLGGGSAVLLGEHGAVAVGDTLRRAMTMARLVEHHAQIAWLLRRDARGANPPAR